MEIIQEEVAPKGVKKRRFTLFRASLVCFVVFTLLCGLAYPLSVTLAAQTAFPYEANGSQIIVTLPNGQTGLSLQQIIYAVDEQANRYKLASLETILTMGTDNWTIYSEELKPIQN